VDFGNTIPCTYFEKDVFAMSSLNWDIERECHVFYPLGACQPMYLHSEPREIVHPEPPDLLQPTSPHSSSPLTNFSLKPSTSPSNAEISKYRYTDNRTCTYNHLMHLLVASKLSAIQNPTFGHTASQTHRIRPSPSQSAKKE
jgi:hypothetical protein